jgi:uncharacterized protein (DUF488 family)
MIYQKKILLSILKEFGGTIEMLSLQRLIFLYCNEQSTQKYYGFLPYTYGPFSFAANTDLTSLKKAGYLIETGTCWQVVAEKDTADIVPGISDCSNIVTLKKKYSNYDADELMKYTLKKYPHYAINCVVAQKLLDKEDYEAVVASKNVKVAKGLFTIGYEGRTVDGYFNLLLQNGIKLLCDVRKNAYSIKPGFSKAQLKEVCDSVGIAYIHYPELGIAYGERNKLQSMDDYEKLFSKYVKETLSVTINEQKKLLEDYRYYGNAALTSFEIEPLYCHTSRLIKSLMLISKDEIPIRYL